MSKHERSSEIRRDIERTRRDMDDTVDELGNRMSPGQLLDQAWSMIRSQGSGAGNVLSEHPVPLAIMGLGVAWLAIERASGSRHGRDHHVGAGTYAPAEGRVGPYLGDAVSHDAHRGVAARVKKGVKDAAGTVKNKTRGTKHWAAGKLGHAGHGVSGAAHAAGDVATHAGEAIRHSADDVRHGIGSFLDSSPLAAGAIAFGLGIASGLSAPHSRLEDRLMGDTSDALRHSVSDTANDVRRQVKHVASDAASAARAEADREDLRGSLRDSATRIAGEAKRAAKETADREGLTKEGLRTRAKRVSDDVSSRAKGRSSNR
jgi:hypothetical protein